MGLMISYAAYERGLEAALLVIAMVVMTVWATWSEIDLSDAFGRQ